MLFFHLMIAALLGLGSPSNGTATTQDTQETQDTPTTGGDAGHTPPPK